MCSDALALRLSDPGGGDIRAAPADPGAGDVFLRDVCSRDKQWHRDASVPGRRPGERVCRYSCRPALRPSPWRCTAGSATSTFGRGCGAQLENAA